jgi:enoyl-CoA hydratase/carnithine racemase
MHEKQCSEGTDRSQVAGINRVVPAGSLPPDGRAFAQSLASGPPRARATTKRILHSWRSGGVAAADEVTHGEGPAAMLSQDLQDGIASLERSPRATRPSTIADRTHRKQLRAV